MEDIIYNQLNYSILSWTVFLPVIGALFLLIVPRNSVRVGDIICSSRRGRERDVKKIKMIIRRGGMVDFLASAGLH